MVVTNHEPEYGSKRFAIHSFGIVKIFVNPSERI